MVIKLKPLADEAQIEAFIQSLRAMGYEAHPSKGQFHTVIGVIGDTGRMDVDRLKAQDIVESVQRICEPYPTVSGVRGAKGSVIEITGDCLLGDGHFQVIAGPCAVESETQIMEVARSAKAAGAGLLRGGAFKPRTSPYAFQGLQEEGIRLLIKAKHETGLPIVTEMMDIRRLKYFEEVDVIQVGARNMQNFELLKELGQLQKPVLLKRGLANTIDEWLMSAEYIMAGGNERVILCERGIRTFENATRNTLDLSAVPVLHRRTHLPVIVDPSHGTGNAALVLPMAAAAVACGADGLMVEVHPKPCCARSDGAQSLDFEEFGAMMRTVASIRPYACR